MALTRLGRSVCVRSGRRLFASEPLNEDYEKYVLQVKENMLQPRFTGMPSFFRLPHDNLISPSNPADTLNNAMASDIDIGLIGVPYDGGVTNRPGARYGPRELRNQTSLVRMVCQSTGSSPFISGGLKVGDIGDVVIQKPFNLESSHQEIQDDLEGIVQGNILPVSIGGDHSISLPILRALAPQHAASGPLGMVHIDAHCDTGDDYFGSRFHHGAPFKIAVDEGLLDPKRVIQIGIRGSVYSKDLWKFSYESGMRVMMMDEFMALTRVEGVAPVIEEISRVVGTGPTYLSFDIDALDPSAAPGTGTPEVGGMTTFDAQQLLRGLASTDVSLVGADLVEVAPPYDVGGLTSLAGANILFEILNAVVQSQIK